MALTAFAARDGLTAHGCCRGCAGCSFCSHELSITLSAGWVVAACVFRCPASSCCCRCSATFGRSSAKEQTAHGTKRGSSQIGPAESCRSTPAQRSSKYTHQRTINTHGSNSGSRHVKIPKRTLYRGTNLRLKTVPFEALDFDSFLANWRVGGASSEPD